jgi:hypothetical protein
MKRLIVLLLVIVVGIVGLGFVRGWFTVNPDKIQQDEQRAMEELRELRHEVKTKTDEDKESSPDK